ncbi:MAG TPA: thiamine-binding protein [Sedimentibacter sp.]|nr:thiamine-binding protein [Sedimentibacter sp.]HOH70184.1 thiamine-binding protein [Sedimentibacter sp.]
MEANIAIQVLPHVSDDEEVLRIVDEVIDYIKGTGLNYYVGPSETSVEGDYDQLIEIVKNCQLVAIRAGAPKVSAYVKISLAPEGGVFTIEEKVSKYH